MFFFSKRKYRRRLIYSAVDACGPIEIVEGNGERSLHFGSASRQSAMFINDPDALALDYTITMMAALLFSPKPKSLLLLGLGGGSIAKFFLKHFPDCQITAVELRKDIADVAECFFELERSPRLRIYIEDAYRFLQLSNTRFDLIFVDLYTGESIARQAAEHSLYQRCFQALDKGGVLATNLWSSQTRLYKRIAASMRDVFESRVLSLPVTDRDNRVIFGLKNSPPPIDADLLTRRAKILREFTGLNFPDLLLELKADNSARI